MIRKLFLIFAVVFTAQALAEPLPVDQAFPIHVSIKQPNQLVAEWNIAPGYYLYHDKIKLIPNAVNQVKLGEINFPPTHEKQHDELVYEGDVQVVANLVESKGRLDLNIIYQGCSSAGFCYAPVKKHFTSDLSTLMGSTQTVSSNTISEQDYVTQLLIGHQLLFVVIAFLGLGLLLSFTPCVLPMIPILSGIIVSHHAKKQLTASKGFLLSLCYVLGMSLTYMVLGIIVALLGSGIQSKMQQPWVIILFSGFFILLACSLLGLYKFQFPSSWQRYLIKWDKHFKSGTYSGVFLMGCFSSLIVSPCVSAPLVGVLAYIAQTGNVVLGAVAFLSLGIGMGLPLLLVGTSAGKLLPRSGPWMASIQKIFGILMLGVAVWLLSRLIPGYMSVLLWALLLLVSAILLGAFNTAMGSLDKFLKMMGIVFFIYGVVLVISSGFKISDPLRPWQMYSLQQSSQPSVSWMVLKNKEQLNQQLALAKGNKMPVILDFYADWCGSCKIIDRKIFGKPEVRDVLKNFMLLRVDLTDNSEFNQIVLKRYHVIAPPTVLFFDPKGKERNSKRFVGDFDVKDFVERLGG